MTGRLQAQREAEPAPEANSRLRQEALQAARLFAALPGGRSLASLRPGYSLAPAGQRSTPLPDALTPLDEELSALIDSIVAGERRQQAAVTAERREAAAAAAAAADAAPPAAQPSPPGPPHRIPPSEAAAFPQPADCAFLRPGQQWEGRQRVSAYHGPTPKQEHWEVSATVQRYDRATGYVCGTMEARNVPEAEAPVTTFFEGEVVDNVNHTFYTADWDACADTDFTHWNKFPSFRALHSEVVRHAGRCPSLASHPCVYMRWKEVFFVRGSECRLTIAGFYYLCLDRVSGDVSGFYFDPSSSPDQKLDLGAVRAGAAGFAFPHYDLA